MQSPEQPVWADSASVPGISSFASWDLLESELPGRPDKVAQSSEMLLKVCFFF